MTTRDGLATMTTFSGKTFNFLEPDSETILIEDIAHGLSLECRFQNQSKVHYSVAQHSIIVAGMVPNTLRASALLHDAAEAYLGDVCKPLKRLLPDYQAIESRVQKAILRKFKLPEITPREVKDADIRLLANEGMSFMSADWRDAMTDPDPAFGVIQSWTPQHSELVFLSFCKLLLP